jgi:hypothetical protein
MEPSIQRYNKIAVEYEDGSDGWQTGPLSLIKNAEPDMQKFELLKQLVSSIHPQSKDDVCFIDAHKQMIQVVPELVGESDLFVLYNVDHHHDMGYDNDRNINEKTGELNIDSSNWVCALTGFYPERFLQYVWIGNQNSNTEVKDLQLMRPDYIITINLEAFMDVHFDKVILCRSNAWVPPAARHLYDELQKILVDNIENI